VLDGLVAVLGGEAKTVAFAVVSGVAGFLAKGVYDLVAARRNDRLDRVNQQLKLLYGPLYALDRSGAIAWAAFRTKVRPKGSFFRDGDPPSEEELKAWRAWVITVFKPQHDEMSAILTRNADLLLESEFVQPLQHFCAHVAAYRVVFDQWQNGDFSQHHSVVDYPRGLSEYLETSFQRLKADQAKLLGQ
jgi:hypothetical protein